MYAPNKLSENCLKYWNVHLLSIWAVLAMMIALVGIPESATAQEEVASSLRRYQLREESTGYYEQYEVLPRNRRSLVEIPGVREGVFPYSPSTGGRAVIRTRLADAHVGLKFYENLTCQYCHPEESDDPIHTVRANITCRQCHGGEPISSINFYYSPMNPIRRHAYVCAKCHEGAGASFASYVIHTPNPAMKSTLREFPVLFFVFWIMIAIAIGTFALFLPHTIIWGIRELFSKKGKTDESDT